MPPKALDKKALWKSIEADERKKRKDTLTALRAARADAIAARKLAVLEIGPQCIAARDHARVTAQIAREARQRARGAKAKVKPSCAVPSDAELKAAIAGARAAFRKEYAAIKELREREARYKARAKDAVRRTAKEAQGESDDEVAGNLPPEMIVLWKRVRRSIKATPRMSRTEAFLKYAEEHPSELYDGIEDETDRMIAEHERSLREQHENPSLVAVDPTKATASNTHVLGLLERLECSDGKKRVFPLRHAPLVGYHACGDRKCPEEGKLIVVYAPRARPGKPSDEYKRTHWGEAPAKHFVGAAPRIASLAEVGPIARIVYTTRKGGDPAGEIVDYDHKFGGTLPTLLVHRCHDPRCAEVGQLVIAGGTYRVTDRGIVG